MQLSKPIKFAVVGLGRIGYRHAERIVDTEGFKLSAICESSPELREKAAHDFSAIGVFSSLEVLLAKGDFDVIVIATPSHLHYSMTMAALDNGKNVLVEKPMASDAKQGKEMLAKAHKVGKFLTVNQTVRYQYDTVAVKRIIESGRIGRVFQVYRSQHDFNERKDWQIWKKYYGGMVSNWAVHFVDAAMLLVDSKPETVFAKFNRILDQGDAEDCYKIVIKCSGGEIVESESIKAYYGKAFWHICGTKGSIYVGDTLPVIKIQTKTIDGEEAEDVYDFRNDKGNMFPYYRDLAEKLLSGQHPAVTPESVIAQLAVIDAARKSDATGSSVNVIL